MRNRIYYQLRIGLCILLFPVLWTGCIKDDLSDCPAGGYRLIIQPDARDQVSSDGIKDVILFIFGENDQFVDLRTASINKAIELSYPGHNKLYVVAWGNTGGGHEIVSPAEGNLTINNGSVRLIDHGTGSQSDYADSPDDLFHGIKSIDTNTDTRYEPDVLTIKRKVASITITAKRLKEFGSSFQSPDAYFYEVRSSKNMLNFYGNLIGEDKKYLPQSSFNTKDELVAPPFFVFPSEPEKYIEVDIYKGNQLVYTINNDQNGMPIRTEEGKLIELIVDFSAGINVQVFIKDWNSIDISDEF